MLLSFPSSTSSSPLISYTFFFLSSATSSSLLFVSSLLSTHSAFFLLFSHLSSTLTPTVLRYMTFMRQRVLNLCFKQTAAVYIKYIRSDLGKRFTYTLLFYHVSISVCTTLTRNQCVSIKQWRWDWCIFIFFYLNCFRIKLFFIVEMSWFVCLVI